MLKTMRTIAPDDPRVGEARQFAERLRHTLATTPRDLPVPGVDRIAGSDPRDAVTCFVDGRGEFLDLSIRSDWYYTVGPSGLGPAVLDALAFAQEKAQIAMLLLSQDGRSAEPAAGNPFAFVRGPEAAEPRDLHDEIALAEARVRRTAALVDAADRVRRLGESPQTRTIAGPRGLFRLTMAGFAVRQADVDEYTVSAEDGDELAEDARAALEQATREKDPRYWFSREG